MCGLSFLLKSHQKPLKLSHTPVLSDSPSILHYEDSLWPFHWAHFHSQVLSLTPPTILCHKSSGRGSSSESVVARHAEGTRQKPPLGTWSQSLLEVQTWERPTRSPGPPKSRSVAPLQTLPGRAAQHPVMAASSCSLALSRQL